MDRMKNPFTPGAGALPPELAGRAAVIEDGRVLSGRTLLGRYEKSLMLIGLRGVGKTVLLKYLAERARASGIVPVVVEVRNEPSDVAELSMRIKEALCDIEFRSRAKAGISKAFSVLRNFVKSISVNIGDFGVSLEAAAGVGSSGNMEYDLSEVLVAAAQAASQASAAVGLYVDELQNLDEGAMRGIIVALHRAAQENLPLFIVGSGLPSVRTLVGKSKTYAERMFNYEDIGALGQADAARAISVPFGEAGVTLEDGALKAIYEHSEGYPYFIQEWGYQLWQETDGPCIRAKDVRRILPRISERLDENFFEVRFDRVSGSERCFIKAMADVECNGTARISDVAKALSKPLSSLSPTRSALIKKGVVYSPAVGTLSFTVPMFADYVKRMMP